MRSAIAILALLLATTSATAAPHVLRDGANHHLGDDSFVDRFGRLPTAADGEPLRMRVHLQYVHDMLAAAPATSPALAGRRAELLGYLEDYIAKGTTPVNTYVPWRNPVFIDAQGNICAVGYLIERSVGRAVPEAIAQAHRLDYLEDIATTMPEVAQWIATSGFTVDELASIQPGYPGPEVMHVMGWLVAKGDEDGWQDALGATLPGDGPFREELDGTLMVGKFKRGQMVGKWTHKRGGKLIGKGTFTAGAAEWTSFRADGSRLAEGPFVKSHPHGEWKIFHPSGRLAAVGMMRDGKRDGTWKFFYDTKANSKLAVGPFVDGQTVGGWKHFDERGKVIVRTSGAPWAGITLEISANAAGVRHEIHQGIPAESHRLDGFYLASEKLYVNNAGEMWDGDGRLVVKMETGWVAHTCKWSKKRKAAARAGDATTLHDMMLKSRWTTGDSPPKDPCDSDPKPVAKARAKRFDKMLATRSQIHAPIPAWDVDPQPPPPPDPNAAAQGADEDRSDEEEPIGGRDNPEDFATHLTNTATWYIEWPHVDDTFRAVYRTLPGYRFIEG